MVFERGRVPVAEVHALLSNPRRRRAIERLASDEEVAVSDLAEAIATAESGEAPPPRPVRESVYASLQQTHLPKLDEAGVVTFDADRGRVRARAETRYVRRYLQLVGPVGLTWDDHYRVLGTLCLFGVVAASVDLPLLSLLPPLGWASLGLVAVAASTGYQLWRLRAAGWP